VRHIQFVRNILNGENRLLTLCKLRIPYRLLDVCCANHKWYISPIRLKVYVA